MDSYAIDEELREALKMWDKVYKIFLSKKTNYAKNTLFRLIYSRIVKNIFVNYLDKIKSYKSLKTDLWNEGVEYHRDILNLCTKFCKNFNIRFYGLDVSIGICKRAREMLPDKITIINATTLCLPLKKTSFDLIIDISTIDHVPPKHILRILKQYHMVLKKGGFLMIVFDSKLNFLLEVYHHLFLRSIYPEYPILPSIMKSLLVNSGFEILEEYGCFLIGLLGGTHLHLPLLDTFLNKKIMSLWKIFKNIELSQYSKYLAFIAPQYVIVARKKN
jgi:SAM-dependent methyltransferase